MRILSRSKLVFLSLTLLLSIPSFADNAGTRDGLAELLASTTLLKSVSGTPNQSKVENGIANLIRSYRLRGIPGTSRIQDGPFVGYVFLNEVLPQYAQTYDSSYAAAYKSNVTDLTLEGMLDLLMGQIVHGGLTGDLAKTGNEIGPCLAQKVLDGSGKTCPLDNSDQLDEKPASAKLLWYKLSCSSGLLDTCEVRKAIFADAKPQLIQARKDGVLAKLFPTIYPASFRSTLIDSVNQERTNIGSIVSQKFNGTVDPQSWAAPLIDLDDIAGKTLSLHEFAMGLRVDMEASSMFANDADANLRGLSAPLFYAAANRLLYLMGGTQTTWNSASNVFVSKPFDVFDPKNPKNTPQFMTERFGGLTAMLNIPGAPQGSAGSGATPVVTSTLDIANYNPTATVKPTPLQLFPSELLMGMNGIPSLPGSESSGGANGPTENLSDLADLMTSLLDFMVLSEPATPLAPHFAADGALDRIIDKTDPALFPRQGRALAAGLIAAEFMNVLSAQGHLEIPPDNSTDPESAPLNTPAAAHLGIFGVKFYDQIGLNGRIEGRVPTDSLARLFSAAARLSQLVGAGDQDIPAAMTALRSQVDNAVQIGLLSIATKAHCADGGVAEYLGTDLAQGRSISTSIDSLRAMNLGYQAAGSVALRQSLSMIWNSMDRYFPANGIVPIAIEGSPQPASLATIWSLLNLWDETKSSIIYADLMNPAYDSTWASQHGWDRWQTRMDALRQVALKQLGAAL